MFGNDPIELIDLAVKELDTEDRREWSGAARSDQLVELLERAERLQSAIVRAVSEWDAHTDWALDGALSPRTWLTHRAPITAVGASKLVGMARLARKHEATGEALRSGDVSCAHVEVLAPIVHRRESEYARNEDALLGAAKSMRADDFGIVARHWRSIADDEMSRLDAREIHERRNLHVHTSLFGMGVLEGDLDAEGTEILLKALDHAVPPDAKGGLVPPRSLAQRRADALVDICSGYLSGNGEGTAPVNLNVTMDHGTLTGSPPDDPRQVRCELEGFGPIRSPPRSGWRATARSPACSCAASPKSSTSAAPHGSRQPHNTKRWRSATAAACSPAVTGPPPGATPTTSSGGNTADPPTNRTSASCAAATTRSVTKAAGASAAAKTAPTKSPNHPPATLPPTHAADDPDARHRTPREIWINGAQCCGARRRCFGVELATGPHSVVPGS